MKKEQIINLKRKILMAGLTGIMIGTIGCGKSEALAKPVREPIPVEKYEGLMNNGNYWTDGVRNNEVTKLYYGDFINFIYDTIKMKGEYDMKKIHDLLEFENYERLRE